MLRVEALEKIQRHIGGGLQHLGASRPRRHGTVNAVPKRVKEAALRRLVVTGGCVRRRPRIIRLLLLLLRVCISLCVIEQSLLSWRSIRLHWATRR